MGSADNPENYMGPVINDRREEYRSLEYIESGRRKGALVAGGGGDRRRIFHSADRVRRCRVGMHGCFRKRSLVRCSR